MIGQVMLWSTRSSLLNPRSNHGVEALAEQVAGQLLVARQEHPRQPELAFLVVEVAVVGGRLADQELRHVVQPDLVEVVAADHDQNVRAGPGEGLPEGLDLGLPLVSERRPVVPGGGARPVVERMVRGRDHRGDGGHGGSCSGGS
jgi:hypothetical protein